LYFITLVVWPTLLAARILFLHTKEEEEEEEEEEEAKKETGLLGKKPHTP
jgi:hypothetical protein